MSWLNQLHISTKKEAIQLRIASFLVFMTNILIKASFD